jgi:hypothetical protein
MSELDLIEIEKKKICEAVELTDKELAACKM